MILRFILPSGEQRPYIFEGHLPNVGKDVIVLPDCNPMVVSWIEWIFTDVKLVAYHVHLEELK